MKRLELRVPTDRNAFKKYHSRGKKQVREGNIYTKFKMKNITHFLTVDIYSKGISREAENTKCGIIIAHNAREENRTGENTQQVFIYLKSIL
jgi:hypothetical protein